MSIHEYQAKEILCSYGIPIPRGLVALTPDQIERAAKMMGGRCVVKAQIYAGGRGKAGGVRLIHHPEEAQEYGKELFGRPMPPTKFCWCCMPPGLDNFWGRDNCCRFICVRRMPKSTGIQIYNSLKILNRSKRAPP